MVYRGKPSTACGECRKRRSRCDQATPCGQCVKAGRTCPGYRNAVDLLFHDESAKVVRKSRGRPSQATSVSTSQEHEGALQRSQPISLTNIVIYQPWDDLGVHFFMSNYVGTDPAVSQLHYFPEFYAKLGYATSSLKKAIVASGLAGYARVARRPDLIEQSTKTYIGAIREINTALSTTEDAIHDTTLMSILMAAMFETMLVSPESGMHNVSKHLEGAMSVAYLSLQRRAPSEVFKSLLCTLVQSVVMNCWIQHVPLPFRYRQLRPYVPEKINPHSVHARLVDVLSRVVEFRDDLKCGHYQSPDSILQKALTLDLELKTFVEEMPNHTLFEKCRMPTVQAAEVQQLVYNKTFHVYPQQFAGHLWNNVRSSRIHLHQLIHQQCSMLLSSSIESEFTNLRLQRSASESVAILLAEEICATVPQLLSYSEYLTQFVNSTEFTLPTRTRSPHQGEESVTSSSSKRTKPASEDSGSNVSSPSAASSPHSTSTHSSYASNKDDPSIYTAKIPLFTPGALDPASAFHLLLKLHNLTLVPWLPYTMKSWIQGRISWIQTNSDPYSAGRLQDMVRKRPCDGFPVSDAPNQIPFGGICESIALTSADQRLWFLAHSWLFVGIDWNADYYAEEPTADLRTQTEPTESDSAPLQHPTGTSTDGPTEAQEGKRQERTRQGWPLLTPRANQDMMMDEGIACDEDRGGGLVWKKPHWTW